jgi:hypothetical protein
MLGLVEARQDRTDRDIEQRAYRRTKRRHWPSATFHDAPWGRGKLTLTGLDYRASVAQECVSTYNELKLSKKLKYIIYKLSDDNKQIVVEESSDSTDWDQFREKLVNATSKSRSVSSRVWFGSHSIWPAGMR